MVWALVATISLLFAGRGFASESQVVESRGLVNSTRNANGLSTLSPQAALDSIAQQHANEMAAKDEIFHYFDIGARADAAGVHWTDIGENVGVGPTIKDVHTAFMNSPGHRANVLYAPYNVIGVGIATGKDGSVFVAHEFATVQSSAPPAVSHTQAAPVTHTVSAPKPAAKTQVAPITYKAPAKKAATPAATKSAFPNALQDGRTTSLPL